MQNIYIYATMVKNFEVIKMGSWINEAVFYQIYPMGFCGAPEYNDCKQEYRLDKIKEWIPHLRELNVNALYLGPVFDSTKHGYDTKDYYRVDTRLGDNASFKSICDELHANGIKIVLDGVFNHVGREFWAFKDVQEKGQSSEYCSWFHNLNFGGGSPCGDPFWYEGWNGHYDLVKLNLRNPAVVDHLIGAVEMWMNEFGIDGLRLDAADCVDFDFFRRLREFCKGKRSDFWLMGEIIHGDYSRWANPEMLDSVTNYECYKGIYSSHNDHNYFEIAHSLQRQFANGGIYKNIYTYNFLDNHDVNRVASNLKDKRHLKNCYTVLYTMPGAPSVYYGSEWGIEGQRTWNSDAVLRPCLDINNIQNRDDELSDFIGKLGYLRCCLPAIKNGGFENVIIKNEQLVFCRRTGEQTIYVAFNLCDGERSIGFNVDCQGCTCLTDVLNNNEVFNAAGYVEISIPANGARILVLNNGDFKLEYKKEEQQPDAEKQTAVQSEPQQPKAPETEPAEGCEYCGADGGRHKIVAITTSCEDGEAIVVYKETDGALKAMTKKEFCEFTR